MRRKTKLVHLLKYGMDFVHEKGNQTGTSSKIRGLAARIFERNLNKKPKRLQRDKACIKMKLTRLWEKEIKDKTAERNLLEVGSLCKWRPTRDQASKQMDQKRELGTKTTELTVQYIVKTGLRTM